MGYNLISHGENCTFEGLSRETSVPSKGDHDECMSGESDEKYAIDENALHQDSMNANLCSEKSVTQESLAEDTTRCTEYRA